MMALLLAVAAGASFASRVCSSILQHVPIVGQSLVTRTVKEFADVGTVLAQSPALLLQLRFAVLNALFPAGRRYNATQAQSEHCAASSQCRTQLFQPLWYTRSFETGVVAAATMYDTLVAGTGTHARLRSHHLIVPS